MSARENGVGFSSNQIDEDDPNTIESQEYQFQCGPFIDASGETIQHALVKVSMGLTINIKNYESARVDAGIEMPCRPDQANRVYENCKKWCEDRIQKEVKAIRGKTRR